MRPFAPPSLLVLAAGRRGATTGAATETEKKTATSTKTKTAPPWNVIVWDDPITLMTYVTKVFMRVFGYPQAKAERLMLEVHQAGRSVVWTGGREQAEVYMAKLQGYYLKATLESAE